MPVWHNSLFANAFHLTYHCPALLKKGVLQWVDLVEGGAIPLSLYDCIAPTWQGVYLEGVHRLLSPPPAAQPQYVGPELGRWVNNWVTRKMLLYMQHKRRHEPRQPPEVWQTFGQLFLPKWDRDFVCRALWRKSPLGTRMERLGGKLCPLDWRVEDRTRFSPLYVRRLYAEHSAKGIWVGGLGRGEGGAQSFAEGFPTAFYNHHPRIVAVGGIKGSMEPSVQGKIPAPASDAGRIYCRVGRGSAALACRIQYVCAAA